eukprot:2148147-Prymnesium_polylepis.1
MPRAVPPSVGWESGRTQSCRRWVASVLWQKIVEMARLSSSALSALALSFNFFSALCTILVNKYALKAFPYPAALTAVHYTMSWLAVHIALQLGCFERGHVQPEQKKLFYGLVVAWA